MKNSIETYNYYESLRELPDSYFPIVKNSFESSYIIFNVNDDNILIYYEITENTLHIKYLDLHSTDELSELTTYFSENKIYHKDLYDISESNLFSENYSDQTDYSESFFLIMQDEGLLIYHETISADWYAEDLNSYDQNRTADILGFFAYHNVTDIIYIN